MTKSNGIASLKQAAKLLNKHSPDGESLAYINKDEAKLLRSHGGSGIQTLSTVPSYASIFGWDVPFTGTKDWGEVAGDVVGNIFSRYKNKDPVYSKEDSTKIVERGQSGMGNLFQDAISVYALLRAKKEKEGLNAAEMSEFNRLSAQLTGAKTEFDVGSDYGAQLKPEYETDITKSAAYTPIDFSGSATPDLTTTAVAEGGRIGYRFGEGVESLPTDQMQGNGNMQVADLDAVKDGYSNLWFGKPVHELTPDQLEEFEILFKMEYGKKETAPQDIQTAAHGGRIGYNLGGIDRPFQGIGALNPRMGYQNAGEVENFNWGGPDVVETANMREEALFNNPIFDRDIQALEKEQTGKFEDLVAQEENKKRSDIQMRLNKYRELVDVEATGGRSIDALIKVAQGHGDNEVVGFLMQFIEETGPLSQNKTLPMGAAQGGRIGFNSGGETAYEKWLIDKYDLLVSDLSWDDHSKYSKLFRDQKAYGGRIGAEKGGIMPLLDMGGMEKDYRQDGGFVPIGRREKADDVPARLSKNEFVFTADAVKAAGGGDIDEGAQRMYNVMKNLEAGGDISEQSQGQG